MSDSKKQTERKVWTLFDALKASVTDKRKPPKRRASRSTSTGETK